MTNFDIEVSTISLQEGILVLVKKINREEPTDRQRQLREIHGRDYTGEGAYIAEETVLDHTLQLGQRLNINLAQTVSLSFSDETISIRLEQE